MKTWNILYRGSLSSCNYGCGYCPFAKTANTIAELREDEAALERFVCWARAQRHRLGILITPWGEALVHRYYRQAMTALSQMDHVYRVAIQTNLSAPLDDFAVADRETVAFWATYHPGETPLSRFAAQCVALDRGGLRHSVGVVGLRQHFAAIEALRALLPAETYLWINAYKRVSSYYSPEEIARLSQVDPYFQINLNRFPSADLPCRAGDSSFTVDHQGDVRRCHFVGAFLGNIFEESFPACLQPRHCPAAACGCHIGYVHRPALHLDELYGEGLLERIPESWPSVDARFVSHPIGAE